MTEVVGVAEVKRHFSEVIGKVFHEGEHFTLMLHKPAGESGVKPL